MRLFLAVLAWAVMVLGVLGAVFPLVSVAFVVRTHDVAPTLAGYTFLSTAMSGLFRIVQSLTIGLGILYLLDVDKRLRLDAAAKERY